MGYGKVIFRVHALKRMAKRHISEADVRFILKHGEVIQDYPNDKPYPSKLLLGRIGNRILHVGAAENAADRELIVITTYEPEPSRWDEMFRTRKRP